jgi:2-methylfumaryl-CoA hydratase
MAMAHANSSSKTALGNYFEDFRVGQTLRHATPRTITSGDVALYMALYSPRFAVQSSEPFAQAIGYPNAPVDDLLVFHIVFGKTVPDISLNAVANLGYAEMRFLKAVYPGDTLTASSDVIGLKENSSGETGVVYVRTTGRNQRDATVLEYVRWVMVRKRDKTSPAPAPIEPKLAGCIDPSALGGAIPSLNLGRYDEVLAGSPHRWSEYRHGERIDHVDGVTLEEAEHQLATRMYQNTAKVHFNQHEQQQGRFKRRLVYGGVIMSLARALSFNGLGNAFHIAGINAGRHVAPCFAGDTIYAWSEILDVAEIPDRKDIGAVRVRLTGLKDRPASDFPRKAADGKDAGGLVLDLDMWLILPR